MACDGAGSNGATLAGPRRAATLRLHPRAQLFSSRALEHWEVELASFLLDLATTDTVDPDPGWVWGGAWHSQGESDPVLQTALHLHSQELGGEGRCTQQGTQGASWLPPLEVQKLPGRVRASSWKVPLLC